MPISVLSPDPSPDAPSSEWIKAADNALGQVKARNRTSNDQRDRDAWQSASDKEDYLRTIGMRKQRVEQGLSKMQGGKEVKVPSYKKGGKVHKTSIYKLHKGERVLNRAQAKSYKGKK